MHKKCLATRMNESKTKLASDTELVKKLMADGKFMKWSELLSAGISSTSLSAMSANGTLEKISWGEYKLDSDFLDHIDEEDMHLEAFIEVAHKAKSGVICLMSAVSYHRLSLDVPAEVWVGIKHGGHKPKIEYPPTKTVFWRNPENLELGIDVQEYRGMQVRITDLERTVVDLYKYRNLPDPTLPARALAAAMQRKDFDREKIHRYAKILGGDKIIRQDIERIDMLKYSSAYEDQHTSSLGM